MSKRPTKELMTGELTYPVPGFSLLDGFTQMTAASDGVGLHELAPHDEVYFRTLNSEYRLIVLEPALGRVRVRGGEIFVEPTDAFLRGSTCGGSMIRVGWIGVGLQLELVYQPMHGHSQNVVTSPVELLFIERARL